MGIFDIFKGMFGKNKQEISSTSTSTPNQTQKPTSPNAKKVLIVEDEDVLANALEIKLNHDGFIVARAANGQIGLETAQTFLPDVVLLDLLMPVMDGKIMLKKLRDLPQFKTTPVIVLTNAGTVDNMQETRMYSGANDFLIKSNVNLDEVILKINRFFPGSRQGTIPAQATPSSSTTS